MAAVVFTAALARAAVTPEQCARCHPRQTDAFASSGMAQALSLPHQKLAARVEGYSYALDGRKYTVADGKETIELNLEWAFGEGSAGETYLYRRAGQWYESRVSYFTALKNLDLTMGAQQFTPHNIVEAAGRSVSAVEAGQCFDCHATHVAKSRPPDLSAMVPGVQCERCHGSADAHLKSAPMKTLKSLSTEETSDFCGQCHRTWADIAGAGPLGVQNVRFQPYRLANSKCYDATDKRIACTACHDPHRPLETSPIAYDNKCSACHTPGKTALCPVAKRDCTSCHMPKIELSGAHKKFTDHMIRIVKAGAPYPN